MDVKTPLKGDFDPDILEVDLNENVREGVEFPRVESLRLKREKGMFANGEVLPGGDDIEGEHSELSKMNGILNKARGNQQIKK